MSGIVELMNVRICSDSNHATESFSCLAAMEFKLTTRSPEESEARAKETLLGTSRDES